MNTLTEGEAAMKFVMHGEDGKFTFNTATSTVVAVHRDVYTAEHDSGPQLDFMHLWHDYPGREEVRFEETLYRTAKGRFFLHAHMTVKYPKGKPVVVDTAFVMDDDPHHIVSWIVGVNAAIHDSTGLDLPEEA